MAVAWNRFVPLQKEIRSKLFFFLFRIEEMNHSRVLSTLIVLSILALGMGQGEFFYFYFYFYFFLYIFPLHVFFFNNYQRGIPINITTANSYQVRSRDMKRPFWKNKEAVARVKKNANKNKSNISKI